MQLRDFLYLDHDRLEDYLSGLGDGAVESVRQTIRTEGGFDPDAGAQPLGAPAPKSADVETTDERTLSITQKHSFARFYEEVKSDIHQFDKGPISGDLKKNDMLEVTAEFLPSPLNQMIESLLAVIETMNKMGYAEQLSDPQSQQVLQMISFMFPEDQDRNTTPMIHDGAQGSGILFVAENKYMLRPTEDFDGEITVMGKLSKVVKEGDFVDLIDLLKATPRGLRRGAMAIEFRKALKSMFENWPEQFGGPVAPESLTLAGPAYILTPLAVYS
jgi:hypothetical protein